MNNYLSKTRETYLIGQIQKNAFVDTMHKRHLLLEEYADYMRETEMKKIIIEDGHVYMVSNNDITMCCNFDDKSGIPLINLTFGTYEREEHQVLLKLIEDGDVIFDIGANYGWYSLNIAKKYPHSIIYGFEVVKSTFDIFAENVKLNNLDNIKLYNFGIGKENTVSEFIFNKDFSGATSMVNLLDRENVEKIKCTIRTLDSFVCEDNINHVDFIKCDIEGAEFFALQGGKSVLEQHRPKLFVEMLRKWSAKFGYHPNDIIQFMANLGYRCFEINQGILSPFDTMTDETISTNFFFLHKEKHAVTINSMLAPPPPPIRRIHG